MYCNSQQVGLVYCNTLLEGEVYCNRYYIAGWEGSVSRYNFCIVTGAAGLG